MNPECPKCGSQIVTKNGFMKSKQRYRCKDCNYNFTCFEISSRGKSVLIKTLSVLLYISRMSIRKIAKLFDVSPAAVLKWIRFFVKGNINQEERKRIKVFEINEMRNFCEKNFKEYNYGKQFIVIQADLLSKDLEVAILRPLKISKSF